MNEEFLVQSGDQILAKINDPDPYHRLRRSSERLAFFRENGPLAGTIQVREIIAQEKRIMKGAYEEVMAMDDVPPAEVGWDEA